MLMHMQALRISLANEPVRWANEFVNAKGVQLLFKKLTDFQQKTKYDVIHRHAPSYSFFRGSLRRLDPKGFA